MTSKVSFNLDYSIILQFRFLYRLHYLQFRLLYCLHYHSFVFDISCLLLVPYVCIIRPCRENLTCINGVTFLGFKDPKDLSKLIGEFHHIDRDQLLLTYAYSQYFLFIYI